MLKKGEPIYDKEMDGDEDGIVTFDEFREYCEQNNADIEQLLKNWLVYHSAKNAEEIADKTKEKDDKEDTDNESSEIIYAKKGDGKYKAVMDSNNDNTITYKEYLEYCSENSKEKELESNDNIKNAEDLTSKKAIKEYSSNNSYYPEGKVETEA